jgi:alpha-tubulin suppressor-like RCC1 family protein
MGIRLLERESAADLDAPRQSACLCIYLLTMRHETFSCLQNITSLVATPTRLFALSSSGHVYALSARASAQTLSAGHPTPSSSPWFGTGFFWGEENTIDFAQLSAPLSRGEKITQIVAGTHHLLARTSRGRAFASPLGPRANSHGQLGLRRISVQGGDEIELIPDTAARERDPAAQPKLTIRPPGTTPDPKAVEVDDIRYGGPAFHEIPALKGINVAQLAAGARSSLARTEDGRVLAWGANEFGCVSSAPRSIINCELQLLTYKHSQLGLGGKLTLNTITRPTEVVLTRSMPTGTRMTCTDITAAGDVTFFTVERSDGSTPAGVDVLAAGNGQFGALGAALYSSAQGLPLRVKNVSGLLEYSEATQSLQPIRPHAIVASSTGHVLLTLDTLARAGPSATAVGRDLLAWGANTSSELGNGRRASTALPASIESAAGRFMLSKRTAKEVRDMRGGVWGKKVKVEQVAVAGPGCSAVYWRIC